jgi:hypothetical protein
VAGKKQVPRWTLKRSIDLAEMTVEEFCANL